MVCYWVLRVAHPGVADVCPGEGAMKVPTVFAEEADEEADGGSW